MSAFDLVTAIAVLIGLLFLIVVIYGAFTQQSVPDSFEDLRDLLIGWLR